MPVMRTGFGEIKDRFNAAEALRQIDCEAVLEHYGARNTTEQRNGRDGTREIVHSCLIDLVEPHHAHGDENPSASMNLDKATYSCYSYWSGGIFDFIKKMEGKEELHDIIGVLQNFLSGTPIADRTDVIAKLEALLRPGKTTALVEGPRYNERAIAAWVGVRHPYLTEVRQITDRAYDQLHLGYDPDTRRVVFPHYVGGRLSGWQQRAIPDRPGRWAGSVNAVPKYKSNPSFPKSSTIYHADARAGASDATVVVESPMSVAKAVSLGMDNVVATFGAKVTDGQLDVLHGMYPLILWFDDDGAGISAERRCCEKLSRHGGVHVVTPEPGKDLGDYDTLEQITAKLATAEPAVLKMMAHKRGIR